MKTRPLAFSVHLLTASGAAIGLLALFAAADGNWREMFAWLGLSLIVDGIDGPLARMVDIRTYAANWDGNLLDLIIDYLTYVLIPAFALAQSGLLPGVWGVVAAIIITFTGVMYFADIRMKNADNTFAGFPGVWHMPMLVLFVYAPAPWVIFGVVSILAFAQFLPLKFIHPVRTVRWRDINLIMLVVWMASSAWAVYTNFAPGAVATAVLLLTSAWLLLAGILMQIIPASETGIDGNSG